MRPFDLREISPEILLPGNVVKKPMGHYKTTFQLVIRIRGIVAYFTHSINNFTYYQILNRILWLHCELWWYFLGLICEPEGSFSTTMAAISQTTFYYACWDENSTMWIQLSMIFFSMVQVNNKPASAQVRAWCHPEIFQFVKNDFNLSLIHLRLTWCLQSYQSIIKGTPWEICTSIEPIPSWYISLWSLWFPDWIPRAPPSPMRLGIIDVVDDEVANYTYIVWPYHNTSWNIRY